MSTPTNNWRYNDEPNIVFQLKIDLYMHWIKGNLKPLSKKIINLEKHFYIKRLKLRAIQHAHGH